MKKHFDGKLDREQGERLAEERAFRLMEAFSGVDEELLARCEQSEKIAPISVFHKNIIKYGKLCAAGFCVLLGGALTWGGYHVGMDNGATGAAESVMENAMYDYTTEAVLVAPEVVFDGATDAEESLQEEKAMAEAIGGTGEGMAGNEGGTGDGDNAGMNATVNATESLKDNLASRGEEVMSPESEITEGVVLDSESDKMVCSATKAREITLEEAYKVVELGEYVPTSVPEGYVLESVYYYENEEPCKLTVCWSRGMDTIFWHIQRVERESLNIVDVEKTETYDEYLYEIPHAETVPEEYREIFSNPICRYEDFSLKFVEKRMISRGGDAGDTDTPRGTFSVLYSDDTVVKFNGRGTAQEVWEMFSSIGNS